MAIKEKVYEFLKNNETKEFSIRQIHIKLKISYPSAQKSVAVLEAEGKVFIRDLGNTKLVKFIKEE